MTRGNWRYFRFILFAIHCGNVQISCWNVKYFLFRKVKRQVQYHPAITIRYGLIISGKKIYCTALSLQSITSMHTSIYTSRTYMSELEACIIISRPLYRYIYTKLTNHNDGTTKGKMLHASLAYIFTPNSSDL